MAGVTPIHGMSICNSLGNWIICESVLTGKRTDVSGEFIKPDHVMFNLMDRFVRSCHDAWFITGWQITSLTTLLRIFSCTQPWIMFDSLKVVNVAMGFNERVIDEVFRSCQLYTTLGARQLSRLIPLRETTAVDCKCRS